MSAGVMELEVGKVGLLPRHHDQPEIHCIVAGSGALEVDGLKTAVGPGSTAFVLGNAEHGIHNTGVDVLLVFHAFATDRLSDVECRLPPEVSGGWMRPMPSAP